MDTSHVLKLIKQVVGVTTAEVSLSVRVDVFSRLQGSEPANSVELDILVTVRELTRDSYPPQRLQTILYERDLPNVKHAGTFGLNYQYRLARLNGFDDALFIDTDGLVSESTACNIGFYDGEKIIWPKAEILDGITMQLIKKGLEMKSIPYEVREIRPTELSTFHAASLTNVLVGAQAVASIDEVAFEIDLELL
jgi:branched-subunit amino acid aminotransferase/4-amino-4-deoxychorismate lyase